MLRTVAWSMVGIGALAALAAMPDRAELGKLPTVPAQVAKYQPSSAAPTEQLRQAHNAALGMTQLPSVGQSSCLRCS
jgi:hypothetical protein